MISYYRTVLTFKKIYLAKKSKETHKDVVFPLLAQQHNTSLLEESHKCRDGKSLAAGLL